MLHDIGDSHKDIQATKADRHKEIVEMLLPVKPLSKFKDLGKISHKSKAVADTAYKQLPFMEQERGDKTDCGQKCKNIPDDVKDPVRRFFYIIRQDGSILLIIHSVLPPMPCPAFLP